MTNFVYANNVSTTLAAAATAAMATLTVASAVGMPTSIQPGYYFAITLNDAATRSVYEICYVTAIAGTTLTVMRAQEGTTAQNWNIGDYAFSTVTAGQLQNLQVPLVWTNGIWMDTGAVNALAITLYPAPTALSQLIGVQLKIHPAYSSTGAFTIMPNGFGPIPVVDQSGYPFTLATGLDAILAGQPACFFLNSTATAFIYRPTTGRLLNVQVFYNSGIYTPTPGTQSIITELVGGGGGSGGAQTTTATETGATPGGTPGSYAKARYTSGFAGLAITVGMGGTPGTPTTQGGTGGTTSFGALVTCPGGPGSYWSPAASGYQVVNSGGPSMSPTGTGLIVDTPGIAPQDALQASYEITTGWSAIASMFPGSLYGIGGAGVYQPTNSPASNGRPGATGLVVIYEYS